MAVRLDVRTALVNTPQVDGRNYTCQEECWEPFIKNGECDDRVSSRACCWGWAPAPIALGSAPLALGVVAITAEAGFAGLAYAFGGVALAGCVAYTALKIFERYVWEPSEISKKYPEWNKRSMCIADCGIASGIIGSAMSITGMVLTKLSDI